MSSQLLDMDAEKKLFNLSGLFFDDRKKCRLDLRVSVIADNLYNFLACS